LLERLSRDLGGLTVTDIVPEGAGTVSIWIGKLTPWPIARGQRHNLAVELFARTQQQKFQRSGMYESPVTLVNVRQAGVSGASVGITNGFALRSANQLAKTPLSIGLRALMPSTDLRAIDFPLLPGCRLGRSGLVRALLRRAGSGRAALISWKAGAGRF
jgi:hypothetical protein